jgi:hypothetical protein
MRTRKFPSPFDEHVPIDESGAAFAVARLKPARSLGNTTLLGIGMKPEFTPPRLYPRLVWGDPFGLLFAAPFLEERPLMRGIVLSLLPSAMMRFVNVAQNGKGVNRLGFGALTPVLVVGLNFIWGTPQIAGAYWNKISVK